MDAHGELTVNDLDAQMAELESLVDSLQTEITSLQRSLQHEQERYQEELDQLAIRRAEYQADAQAVGPDRDRRLNGIGAREAEIAAELQRIDRDRMRPLERQQLNDDERDDRSEELQDERSQLQAERARVESEVAGNLAQANVELQRLDVRQAEMQAQSNRAARETQARINDLNQEIQDHNRNLERLRRQRSALLEHDQRETISREAERLAEERTRDLRAQFQALAEERERLSHELSELAPVVEAQREATSSIGATELGQHYEGSANDHKSSWKLWLWLLIGSVLLAAVGGPIAISELSPSDEAKLGEIVTASAIGLLVVGLLIYLVRISSLQFRAHRNLEAIDRSKAAALKTYNGLVAGPASPEVRTAVAAVLAEAVFRANESGFLEASTDQITIIERIVSSAAQRALPPP